MTLERAKGERVMPLWLYALKNTSRRRKYKSFPPVIALYDVNANPREEDSANMDLSFTQMEIISFSCM